MTRDNLFKKALEIGQQIEAEWQMCGLSGDEEGCCLYADFASEVAVRLVDAERDRIIGLLKGIDEQDGETDHGWWETSTGAEFGAGILTAIRTGGQQ